MVSLWDKVAEQEVDTGSQLETVAMGLITKILKIRLVNKHDKTTMRSMEDLNRMIDTDLLDTLKTLNLDDELELSYRLRQISDKEEEFRKNKMMRGRALIALGGQFSAGKSAFINSLFNTHMLPEDINPTTSLPTFFMSGEEENILAYTRDNRTIGLTSDELQALTHAFYEEYHVSFAPFIKNLIVIHKVEEDTEKYGKLVFIDTPGYSKPDDDRKTKRQISDYLLAQAQLLSADALLWLIDGRTTMTQSDLEFLESLHNPKRPVLIVFTRADMRTEEDMKAQMEFARKMVKNLPVNIVGVTSYSSKDGKEYFGEKQLENFFTKVTRKAINRTTIGDEIEKVKKELESQLIERMKTNETLMDELRQDIADSEDILSIRSLIELYRNMNWMRGDLHQCQANLDNVIRDIVLKMKQIEAEG